MVKTIPLSIALAALSTGTAFAAADDFGNKVQVEIGNGKYYTIDLAQANIDTTYKARVKSALIKAFEEGDSILVYDTDNDSWIDFGKYAGSGATLEDMLSGEDTRYVVDLPDEIDIYNF
jgi:hypothetical protein